jgi:hypothetical protein
MLCCTIKADRIGSLWETLPGLEFEHLKRAYTPRSSSAQLILDRMSKSYTRGLVLRWRSATCTILERRADSCTQFSLTCISKMLMIRRRVKTNGAISLDDFFHYTTKWNQLVVNSIQVENRFRRLYPSLWRKQELHRHQTRMAVDAMRNKIWVCTSIVQAKQKIWKLPFHDRSLHGKWILVNAEYERRKTENAVGVWLKPCLSQTLNIHHPRQKFVHRCRQPQ